MSLRPRRGLPFEAAARAAGAVVRNAAAAPGELLVVTDTRTLRAGDTFLALRGERFDGHDFAAEAAAKGASAIVLEREDAVPEGVTALLVPDTLRAYMALAGEARKSLPPIVAITGSTGKTTVKVLLEQLLAAASVRAAASPGNENNEIGVSSLLLAAYGGEDDVIVAEFGARHPGDIARLAAMTRPEVGVLTNVGEAHLEIMGSREAIEETKWSLFSTGARAVLNYADAASRRRAPTLAHPPLWFLSAKTLPEIGARERICAVLASRLAVRTAGAREEYAVEVHLPGEHNRANLAAALAALVEIGAGAHGSGIFDDPRRRERVVGAIARLRLPAGRYEPLVLAGGMRVIYDAYNANPSSTVAALDAFAAERTERRVAVLASMAELGSESEALHESVGAHAAGIVDWLLVGGEFAESFERGARRAGLSAQRIIRFSSNDEAANWLREHASANDLVLLKGSRKYRLEEIVEMLRGPQ